MYWDKWIEHAAAQGFGDFQVASRRGVEAQVAAFVFDGKLGDVGQRLQLRRLGVTVKRAGGGQRQLFIMDAEAGQVAAAEVFGQGIRRRTRVEVPVRQVLTDGRCIATSPGSGSILQTVRVQEL